MANSKKYCIANWKMYMHSEKITRFIEDFRNKPLNDNIKVVLCPNYIDLSNVNHLISDCKNIKLGSQDVSEHIDGPFTGDISIEMLSENNCEFLH